MLRSKILR